MSDQRRRGSEPPGTGSRTGPDFRALVEDIRTRLAAIDAYADAAEELLHRMTWNLDREQRRLFEHLDRFIGDAARSARSALDHADRQLAVLLRDAPGTTSRKRRVRIRDRARGH